MPKAMDVLRAAHYAFFNATNDDDYAKRKSNTFLHRCGADPKKGPDQEMDLHTVKGVVFSMLDADSENDFYAHLLSAKGK